MAGKIVLMKDASGDEIAPVATWWATSHNASSASYKIFARIPVNDVGTVSMGSFLVSGANSATALNRGLYFVQVVNRNSAFTISVSPVSDPYYSHEFGYYDGGDGYIYIGVYRSQTYGASLRVLPITPATDYKPLEFDNFADTTTAPTGWTKVPINIRFADWTVATIRASTSSVTAAGWYRVAEINQGYLNSTAGTHPIGQISITGGYSAYRPSKGVFSFSSDGGTNDWNIVQLSGCLATSPTKIRITGVGLIINVDVYFTQTGSNSMDITVEGTGVGEIDVHAPVAVADAPSGETIRATLDIGTITTGRVVTTT